MKRLIALAVLAAALAACGEKAATTDTAAAPDAAAGPNAAPAASIDVPPEMAEGPAAGKWKITMTSMGQTLPASEVCYATKTSLADAQKAQQQAGVTCTEQSYKREGDAYVGHSVCTMDMAGKQVKTTTDMRVTGDFDTKYTMDMTNKMDPEPAPGMGEQKIQITAERVGDC